MRSSQMGNLWTQITHAYYYWRAKSFYRSVGGGGSIVLIKNDETGFAELIIDNVKKRNAISGKMMLEFIDVISTLEKWKKGKFLLIRGQGEHFCSGGDLDIVRQLDTKERSHFLTVVMTDCLSRLSRLPIVSAVFINGSGALGGGAEISVAADYRIMDVNSKFGFVHQKMGIAPAWGATMRLKNILGQDKGLKILLEAKIYTAEEALKAGLVDCLEEHGLDGARQKLFDIFQNIHYDVVRNIKKSFLSNCLIEQGRLCAQLIGGEQNLKALNNKIKHNVKK